MVERDEVRISLPSKGRLAEEAVEFMAACGMKIHKPNPRQYAASIPALPGLTVLFQRPTDIVISVRDGSVDFGITGLDVTREHGGDHDAILVLHEALGFGACRLAAAVPESWSAVRSTADLAREARSRERPLRVATQFTNLTRSFLVAQGIEPFELVYAEGTLEVAPTIGYADCIVDLVSSGQTLQDNRLRALEGGVVLRSQAALIANRMALSRRPEVLSVARTLLEFTEAHLRAQDHLMVVANMRGESPRAIATRMLGERVLGGLQGPTIAPVLVADGNPNWYAVQIVVRRDELIEAIAELRAIGGSGVVVTPVTYIFEEEPERYRAMMDAVKGNALMIAIYENPAAGARILNRRTMQTVDEVPAAVLASIARVFGEPLTPEAAVARLLADVRARGDCALREWTQRIDGVTIDTLEIPREAWEAAYRSLAPTLSAALEHARVRIREFHERQPIPSWSTDAMGGTLGQRLVPLEHVGLYVPGGTAPLPSSLLMGAVPARVAGVDEIVVCTPADRETGSPSALTLAAAYVADVDRVFALGGALAVGAMAFGTESVPRVDKVVGAGGLFTTVAKRQVYGIVGLDGLYGPTETVVVADDSANPAWVAADLLAQAEHDVLATAILLTPSRALAEAVQAEVTRQAGLLSRAGVIETSLAGQGGIVLTPDLATAVRLADRFAPEHLCLSVTEPEAWVGTIRNAGGIFIGEHSFEVLGDYVAGPSHIMPTGGTARFNGPVNVLDFVKVISIIGLDAETARALATDAETIASAESLSAHAAAARWRAASES